MQMASPVLAQQVATSLANLAFKTAQEPSVRTPWAVEVSNQPSAGWMSKMFPRGGKMDDITVVVAFVAQA